MAWILATLLWLPALQGWAQDPDPEVAGDAVADADAAAPAGRGTGDALIDARLDDIDRYAGRHREAFVDELVRYRGAPRALVQELLASDRGWSAGDVYFACALAQVAGRPCRAVVTLRERAPAAGWAALAAQLGVGPDGDAHRRLRSAISDSYRRWARPLPDAE